jgi:hypothetical protein
MTFPYQAILSINGNIITDHNRAPLDVSYDRIEARQRMANGTLRVNHISTKMKISTSWSNVVSSNNVVDAARDNSGNILPTGPQGASYLKDLYYNSTGNALQVYLTFKSGATGSVTGATFNMIFSSFDYSVVYRGPAHDIVNMSVELEQV